jgi:hypothetical protein
VIDKRIIFVPGRGLRKNKNSGALDAWFRMTDKAVELDERRGMAAQKATELRRLLAEVQLNEQALRARQDDLETQLLAAPAATWEEAAEKARYLLTLFAASLAGEDPRRQKLIAAVLEDFDRLSHHP